LKQYGPRLMNNKDPTEDFKNAEAFLKKIPTMKLTVIQRRLCELVVKTCRLLLITEHYGPSANALKIFIQEEFTTIQDKLFQMVLALLQDRCRLLYDLAILIWKNIAFTATTEQIEHLIELSSPNPNVDDGGADEQDIDAGGKEVKEGIMWPVRDQPKKINANKADKSLDAGELHKEEGEDKSEVTKPIGEPAVERDLGDKPKKPSDTQESDEKAKKSSDIQETEEKDAPAVEKDLGDKPKKPSDTQETDEKAKKSSDTQETEEKDAQGSKPEQNDDSETSSSSSDEGEAQEKGKDGQPASGTAGEMTDTDGEMDPPTEKDLAMLKNFAMAIVQNKRESSKTKYIKAQMGLKIVRLLEIFSEMRSTDPLNLTMIVPLLELYCGDPNGSELAKKLLTKISKRRRDLELLIEGVDMATMEDIMDDAITVALKVKIKMVLEWAHAVPILWLFKLYFKLAKKEGKLAQAEKWVQEQYNQFWSGFINHSTKYKAVSLPVFREGYMRFPQLLNPMLDYIFKTIKEDKITKTFDIFQTLCLLSLAATWRDKVSTFHTWRMEYAKAFCLLLPKLVKRIHKKKVVNNFGQYVKYLDYEDRCELLNDTELEPTLKKYAGDRALAVLFYLKEKNLKEEF